MAKKKEVAKKPTPKKQGDAVKNWLRSGSAGLEAKRQQDALRSVMMEKFASRFFLKPGEPAEGQPPARLVWLDDEGQYCNVHEIWKDNKKSHIVCVKEFRTCPVCVRTGKNPIYTAHYTVIDTRSFVRTDGTTVKNRKILFPAKGSAIYIVADLKKKNGSLVGLVFDVKRYTKEEPTCGGHFDKAGKLSPAQWTKLAKDAKVSEKEIRTPVDYLKVLGLPTDEELAAMGYSLDSNVIASTGAATVEETPDVPDDLI